MYYVIETFLINIKGLSEDRVLFKKDSGRVLRDQQWTCTDSKWIITIASYLDDWK